MKILIINSRYFISAGPERYMFNLIEVLKKHGHEVIPFSTKNKKNNKTIYEKYFADAIGGNDKVYYEEYNKFNPKTYIEMFGRQYYSFHVKNKLIKLIKATKPDIAYILHHYNKLSPSIIDACKKENIPIVMRLSDFFLVCPESHLLNNSKPCEDCIKKSLYSAVKNKCVKNSTILSAIKSSALTFHRIIKIYDKVDHIICPSEFTLKKVQPVLKKRISYIPTFTSIKEPEPKKLGDYALFVGRVEEEKGLLDAIKAFEYIDFKLKIVGNSHSGYDKILKDYINKNNVKNIEFTGPKYGKNLHKMYRDSRFFVFPVVWYENMPNVALEAMRFGKPIITTDIGSMREIVKNNVTGFLVSKGNINELKEKIKLLIKNTTICKKLGDNIYKESITKYSEEKHYDKLIKVFESLVK